jgi:2-polyprenyl-3-methyl-5-hydroxy-6-metoxy-1,4-benzoquinol methylase
LGGYKQIDTAIVTKMRHTLYQVTGIPAMQNRLYSSYEQSLRAATADIDLAQDATGLVYNRCFNPDLVTYDESYQNDQGYSIQFQNHLEDVCHLCSCYVNVEQGLVVDIGCGKGGFVELLRRKGFNAVGYDNTYQGESYYIRKSLFGAESHEKGSLLTLRHVLEHVPSPWQFLASIAEANHYTGYLYIEVPDLDWILRNNAYFDIFHEHVNYFMIDDFIQHYGDALTYHSRSFGDQYLSLIVNLEHLRTGRVHSPFHESSQRIGLQACFDKLSAFGQTSYSLMANYSEIVIWGAGAKGVMLAAKAPESVRSKISFAIDINPSKQGQFMPISGVKVFDPTSGVENLSSSSLVIIMNPNYEQEIRASLPHYQPCLVLQ